MFLSQQGFTFPPQAGYALDTNQARFYLMETHYNNPKSIVDGSSTETASGGAGGGGSDDGSNTSNNNENSVTRQKADNSGLKLYYTNNLRKHDAGVLSIGKFFFLF